MSIGTTWKANTWTTNSWKDHSWGDAILAVVRAILTPMRGIWG